MKLCRFELLSGEPGVRSGIVFSGKIYETDGAEARGMHEPQDVRLLSPILPPAVRLFRSVNENESENNLKFQYLNAGILAGPQTLISIPPGSGSLHLEAYLAVIAATDLLYANEEQIENTILGYSIFGLVVDDAAQRRNSAASLDFGAFLGPVITTLDETEDRVLRTKDGDVPQYTVTIKVNQVEVSRGDTSSKLVPPATAISTASQTAPVRSGDVMVLGPVARTSDSLPLGDQDELTITAEGLGAITIKLTLPSDEE